MLDPAAKALAQGPNLAALTTLLPGGQPSTQLVWVDADDSHLMVNTEVGRQKYRNVQRDPRVSLALIDSSNPYVYVEIRGRVVGTVTGAEARHHIDRLSERYTGAPYARPIESERVILQIEPERTYSPG